MDWRELWHAKDLVQLLVRRDLVTKYAQTILGPLWFILQPLGLAIVLSVTVNSGGGIGTAGVPPFLFNLCSLAPWFYFSQTFGGVGGTFVANADLFQKVYFPRTAVPLALALSNLLALGIQTGLFLLALVIYRLLGLFAVPSWHLVLLPLLYLELFVFSLGAGLCAASLTARYRDLVHGMQYLLLILMFASVVFIPLGSLPARLQFLVWANPLAVIIEETRSVMLGTPGISPLHLVVSALLSLGLCAVGMLAFEKASRTAVDVA